MLLLNVAFILYLVGEGKRQIAKYIKRSEGRGYKIFQTSFTQEAN